MAKFEFSSACDPRATLQTRQVTLRHLFALVVICSILVAGYSLVKRAIGPHEFLDAAQSGDIDSLRELARSGVDIHYRDGWHTTALMMAASHGQIECVQFLIDSGANPNERSRFNATPLIWAAESGYKEIAELLIENGAVPSLVDESGLTASDHARQNGYTALAGFINNR